MTKNLSHNPTQKLYRNWTGNQIRGIGQFLVKTWSTFSYTYGQPSGRMRVEILRQHCGKVSVVLGFFQAKSVENQGRQKVSRNGADFEDFQAKRVHQPFTETSPDLGIIRRGVCRQRDGKMSAVFNLSFVLLPRIAQYMRKSPVQFDIPSSYLYVVVLRKVCL